MRCGPEPKLMSGAGDTIEAVVAVLMQWCWNG